MRMRHQIAGSILGVATAFLAWPLLTAEPAGAEEQKSTGTQISTPARLIEQPSLVYPASARRRNLEGWVLLSYVIDTDGSVKDVIVTDSSARDIFNLAAISGVKKWKYAPAMVNGQPTVQCNNQKLIVFEIDYDQSERGARRSFVQQYRKASALVQQRKYQQALDIVHKLEEKSALNLYEIARLSLLKAGIDASTGRLVDAIRELKWTTRRPDYMEQDLYAFAVTELFKLQVNQKQYRDALNTYARIEKYTDRASTDPEIIRLRDHLKQMAEGTTPFGVKGIITKENAPTFWRYAPLRREFAFQDISGKFDDFSLRCTRKHFTGEVTESVSWKIPQDWGRCTLYVFGQAGSAFTLVEY